MINGIRIKDLRSIKSLNWEFPENGLILIRGLNGAGKSTFVESILFALFGTDALRTAKTFASDGNAEVSVVGKFHTPFEVLRTFGGVTTLKAGGVSVESAKAVTAWFQQLTDLKTFCQTFVSQQTEINNIARARPFERKKTFAELLGFGLIDDCVDAVKVPRVVGAEGIESLGKKVDDLKELESLTGNVSMQDVMRIKSLQTELQRAAEAESRQSEVIEINQVIPTVREQLARIWNRKQLLEVALGQQGGEISCPLCAHPLKEDMIWRWRTEIKDVLEPEIRNLQASVSQAELLLSQIPRSARTSQSIQAELQKYGDVPADQAAEALSLISRLRAEISMLESTSKAIVEANRLGQIKKIFTDFRDWLIKRNLKYISELVTFYLSSYTKWSTFELRDDFTIFVDGRPIETYSEGEKNMSCTVFRFAVTKLLSEQFFGFPPFLILDSSFDAVDENNFNNAISLASACAGEFSQIFVTTHHEITLPGAPVYML